MKKLSLMVLILSASLFSLAQNETQSFGKVEISDLELKECSFEKDANAMVLFDKGHVYFDQNFDIILQRHKRIKVFNEKGKDNANVRLEFYSANKYEEIYDLSAQTINLKEGKPVITKLDKKQVFRESIDKNRMAIIFSFPDVQSGTIIEYKYVLKTPSYSNFPTWYFQSSIPTRYSELETAIPDLLNYKTQYRINQAITKNKTSSESRYLGDPTNGHAYTLDTKIVGVKNIVSLADEPFMTSRYDNLQCALFQLTMIRPIGGFVQTGADTWTKVGTRLSEDEDFGLQFRKKLEGEDVLIAKAKSIATDDHKIAFLFNEVKAAMKWNGYDNWYTNDGTPKAWQKKTGNSTEINLILYRLLKEAGVKQVSPMIVSTRENGKVNISFPWLYQFNRTVVHIPIDSTKSYILDASDKHNMYNTTPGNLLNSYGIAINKEEKTHQIVSITSNSPSRKNIFINANIAKEGSMSGTAILTDYTYHKIKALREFKTLGAEKYNESLSERDNTLKIKSIETANAEIDSLPLQKTLSFELELTASDGEYIYFVPNLFTGLNHNPFLNENRTTMIDFGANNKYQITGIYKVPEGFKVDVLPKNINFVMPDKSISFQRMVIESEGTINVRYLLDYKKSIYDVDEYPMLREFYKQLTEMLKEQIVLKKS